MEAFGVFRLLAESRAVRQELVLFRMDRNIIFLYLVMHKKHWSIQMYVCNTVIVAWIENKLVLARIADFTVNFIVTH